MTHRCRVLIVQHLNWSVAVPDATICLGCGPLRSVVVISHTMATGVAMIIASEIHLFRLR